MVNTGAWKARWKMIVAISAMLFLATVVFVTADDDVIAIGNRRQLFLDDTFIESLEGVEQVLHHPEPEDIAIAPEHPWEKDGVSYMVTFKEGEKFRAWYRVDSKEFEGGQNREMTAYAESDDGIHWRKPVLGLLSFEDSLQNNLVWIGPGGNMSVFRDENPAAKESERYKAIVVVSEEERLGLLGLISPDGLSWRLVQQKPIITDPPFDSHNIVFWDEKDKQYVVYMRGRRKDGILGRGMEMGPEGVRWIRRTTSKDFLHWTVPEPIKTEGAPLEELYTNAAIRYERAPDYLLMFPSRYASSRVPDPEWKYGKGLNDIVLMSSRDGITFARTFMEAFLRPGLDQGNWHERSLYMERGILETSPTELSLYAMQNWRSPTVHIRRYTLRPDGFVSLHASYEGGELVTKPFTFSGNKLRLNYSTSAVGFIQVEIQDADGRPFPGFSLADSPEMYANVLDGEIRWNGENDVSHLAGRPVRLRIRMSDADLYAFRFSF